MSGIKDQAELDDIRKKLYERGGSNREHTPRGTLSDIVPSHMARSWETLAEPPPAPSPIAPPPLGDESVLTVSHPPEPKKRPYRLIILIISIMLFLGVLGVSGMYMFLGNNQISNKNIAVAVSGPLSVGGGDTLPLEVAVTNSNTVPIESAVVIVNYPSGTLSTGENPRDLLEDRITVGTINAGEEFKLPVSAIVFGEEGQTHEVRVTVEYRLRGSNGTFYKEAEPYSFQISSSPIVIRVEAVEKVSSGQEIDITLTVQSNAPTPLRNILVTADYPVNFDYSSAKPAPTYRENSWLIAELKPERAETITLKGVVVGKQDEEFRVKFAAGSASAGNQFEMGSLLAVAEADFVIEQPFIGVGIAVNGVESSVVTAKTGQQTEVSVRVRNTLTDTLYNMAVEVALEGNVVVRDQVSVQNGFYDSVKDVIRFEPSGQRALEAVPPGETVTLNFAVRPSDRTETPSFKLEANAYARRVSERNASEQLVGTANAEVKFTSVVTLTRELGRSTATGFTETGPFPPVADIATTYTATLIAEAGGNDVSGATVVTPLPQYVKWQNQTAGDGRMEFNPVTNEITWTIGEIDAGAKKQMAFQVAIVPSQNQIGKIPAILDVQRFRATDRFTGDVVRAEAAPLSTELSREAGYEKDNGVVRRTEGAEVER